MKRAHRERVFQFTEAKHHNITRQQAQTLKEQRWAWNIQFGIVCRKPDEESLPRAGKRNFYREVKLIRDKRVCNR